ncbi:MAG: glycosyltransferase [Acidimicrobiales bacterium]|jgi:glycosyltransferase involved in cell wall biosynthesis/GT2 family glycosyltransferase/Flp pilus assembly protein TadD
MPTETGPSTRAGQPAGPSADDTVNLVGLARLVPDRPRRCGVVGSAAAVVVGALRATHPACDVASAPRLPLPGHQAFDALILLEDAFDPPDGTADELLRSAATSLRPGGLLVARTRSARHAPVAERSLRGRPPEGLSTSRFEREELVDMVRRSGLELGDIRWVVDPALEVRQLPIDGEVADVAFPGFILRGATAGEVEALSSSHLTFTARRPPAGVGSGASAIRCSVLVALCTPPRSTGRFVRGLVEMLVDPGVEVVVAASGRAADDVLYELGAPSAGSAVPDEVRGRLAVIRVVEPQSAARLWNTAARRARGRYLAFLQDDLAPDPWWTIELIWEFVSRQDAGVVSGRVLDPSGRVEQAGFGFGPQLPFHTVPVAIRAGADPGDQAVGHLRTVGAVSLQGAMMRREALLELGGLDERYLGEDVALDLSLRLRSRGLTCLVAPTVTSRRVVPAGPRGTRSDRADRQRFIEHWGARLATGDPATRDRPGAATGDRATARPVSGDRHLPILWSGVLLDRSGYASEGRSMVLGLEETGIDVRTNPIQWGELAVSLAPAETQRLLRTVAYEAPDRFIHVTHSLPSFGSGRTIFQPVPGAALQVARTMFETDRIPVDWVELCNRMDQVWVPSRFNVDTFARSGVAADKLRVVPSPISVDAFGVDHPPIDLPGSDCFAFLSVFAWGLRKGWDVLVRSFVEEFERGEAKLLMKVTPAIGCSVSDHRDRTERYIATVLGRDPAGVAEILFVDVDMGVVDLARLYRSADAFVLPSRGEGWGRPYMEAMASGLPTIGSRWGGNLDFMDDTNSYLVDCGIEDVPAEGYGEVHQYAGHRWAAPSVEHLRTLMRRVTDHPDEAAERGGRGRTDVLGTYGTGQVALTMVDILEAAGSPPARTAPPRADRPLVRWEGPQFVDFGMATVNRELCRRLEDVPDIELLVADGDGDGREVAVALDPTLRGLEEAATRVSDRPVDVTVRHAWPPDFSRPPAGKLVVCQPWDYGSAPRSWVGPMNEVVDEVWVPSRYVRDCYIRSGVDPTKVVVVPNAVDVGRFSPGAPPTDLVNDASFRFLFVGGTLWRKGADILVDTYLRTFTADDDVCLVIKDFGTTSFYEGQGLGDVIRQAVDDPSAPAIEFIDWDLTAEATAGLYTACDCLVHPYRGEGFALPVAEAMASGLPVVVPRFGPVLDYCDDTVAHLLAATEATSGERGVGDLVTVAGPWWGEIDRRALADTMRRLVDDPTAAEAMGARAAERIRSRHTWDRSVATAVDRLRVLAGEPGPDPAPSVRSRRRQLSVCMIVKDEAAQVGAAIDSVRAVADEIVVIDTGSTDGTADIAAAHGATVHHRPWTGSFAVARNEAIDCATRDWILMLDADQRLDEDSATELRRITQVELPTGYLLRQFNYTEPEGRSEFVEHLIVRLFPNHAAIRYEGDVHEQVACSDPSMAFPLAACGVVLHHEGYRPQFRNSQSKASRDRVALQAALERDPSDTFALYNMGITCRTLGDDAAAADHLRRAVGSVTTGRRAGEEPAYLLHGRVELVRALIGLGLVEQAREAAEAAVAHAPQSADANAVLGAACLVGGRLEEALVAYRRVGECPDVPALAPTDRSLVRWRGMVGMAQVLGMQQRWEEAREVLGQARSASGDNPSVLLTLAEVLYGMGDGPGAVDLLRGVTDRPDAPPVAWSLLADVLIGLGDPPGADAVLREGLARFPGDPVLQDRDRTGPGMLS